MQVLRKGECCEVSGYAGSFPSLLAAAAHLSIGANLLYISENTENAQYVVDELRNILPREQVLYFPEEVGVAYSSELIQNANTVLRTEVINQLYTKSNPVLIVAPAAALANKIIAKDQFSSVGVKISKNENLTYDLAEKLAEEFHFELVDYVSAPGEYAVRGGILDVFSFGLEYPVRLRFFGNNIESIQIFSNETQLTEASLDEVKIIANIENNGTGQSHRVSFLSILPKNSILFNENSGVILSQIEKKYQAAVQQFEKQKSLTTAPQPSAIFVDAEMVKKDMENFTIADFCLNKSKIKLDTRIDLQQQPQPVFHKNFEMLAEDLQEKKRSGIQVYISFSTDKQKERLDAIFEELEHETPYLACESDLHAGFVDSNRKIAIYTDHQIFDRYHKFKSKNSFAKSEQLTLKEMMQMKVGDLVTHVDHGIGKFLGLVKVNNGGKTQEAFKLQYKNKDLLYVSIHSLHKISRHGGVAIDESQLSKLGSPAWKALKNKTKKKVKELSFDLIKLYAKRKTQKGFAFSPDTYLQTELEASFIYEDTPDQERATQAVKQDMEDDGVMDRLICGDVGFGKTEIAVRAAFKAATDGKQVAVLVPTTVLAFQHFRSFSERLKDFPVTVGYLNRFRSAKEKKATIAGLADGSVDIVIGTHQLASPQVKFIDLGLLIIDEEHKFGVSVKDKLKTIKANIDTLTLTATPIPRTLQFSLMAARDLSVIQTPPPNRQPVETHLVGFDQELIRDAVMHEMERGGQVFFINNRIENLKDIAGLIQTLVPDARITTGHGQLEGKELENRVLDFMDGKYDVLVSTTIVESGVDVPNANTIFINDAQRFGMADLHQMRGRVGRSNRKAFCYLIAPSLEALPSDSRKRLEALQQYSDLGSGFHIAMKDLEIRGAGDLLGAEQSGFINEMGFETYQKIVQEALEELQDTEEFRSLFEDNEDRKKIFSAKKEVMVDTDWEIMLPDEYIRSTEERLVLYQRLADIHTQEDLAKFRYELEDRYGKLPEEAERLLASVELKWSAEVIGFEKIIIKNNVFLGYFPEDGTSLFYTGKKYESMIRYISTSPKNVTLKEKDSQYYLRKAPVENIEEIKKWFEEIVSPQFSESI